MSDSPEVFVVYSLLLALVLFAVAVLLRKLFARQEEQKAFVIGAVLGASANALVWLNWFFIPRESWMFGALARFTLFPGAPGVFIPGLWGKEMLLHHPHYSTLESLWQWTLLTVLDVGVWSLVFATVARLFFRDQS